MKVAVQGIIPLLSCALGSSRVVFAYFEFFAPDLLRAAKYAPFTDQISAFHRFIFIHNSTIDIFFQTRYFQSSVGRYQSRPRLDRRCSPFGSIASKMSMTTTPDNKFVVPNVSSRIQTTLDPCVVLMKELIGRYAHLWEDKGGIFSLAQGVVYWKPPSIVTTALLQALQDDQESSGVAQAPQLHTYGPDEGLPELRAAIQQKIKRENGLVNHNVMVTVGANQAYTNCILSLLNQDQKVVVFAPYYFNHVMAIQMALPAESLVVGPCNDDGIPDLDWLEEALKADPSIHMVTIVNPGNPTGVTLPRQVLQKAVDLCRDHQAWLVLDCTYEYFVFLEDDNNDSSTYSYELGGCFPDPHVIHIFSFSKSYGMAGYRCGYIAVSNDAKDDNQQSIFEQMLKVQDTIPIAPSRIAQIAALAAMQEAKEEDDNKQNNLEQGTPGRGKLWVQEQFGTLQEGRHAICKALETLGKPMGGSGAMYVMSKLPPSIPDDKDFAERLVKDYGVAIIPGSFCGFPGWVRVCYSNLPPEKCLQAAERLERGIREMWSSSSSY